MSDADIIIVTDGRFAGGTATAAAADVRGFLDLGARVGLLTVRSGFLNDAADAPNPKILELYDLDGVVRLVPGRPARAEFAFFHHPMVFFTGVEEGAPLTVARSAVVAHHPPFRGDGSLEYDPLRVVARIRSAFGARPMFAPISGLLRRQLESFAPLLRLTSEDWCNLFDTERFAFRPDAFSGPLTTIGRHGRVDMLKWPDTAEETAACLPTGPGRRIRVMGCPEDALRAQGVDLSGWELLPFGAEAPDAFLRSLDVFSYFHSSIWVESFGRTIAEAALSGAYCVLDPRLQPTFGDIGTYCRPAEVADVIARLAADPKAAQAATQAAREKIAALYTTRSLERRWTALRSDGGVAERGAPSADPATVARKLAGLYHRRWRWGAG